MNAQSRPLRIIGVLALAVALSLALVAPASAQDDLAQGFQQPPPSARPWVYWFWLNGNITREGITADLEAMARVGIGGVLIMEVDQGAPVGPVPFAGAEWRELFRFVVSEAHRLGLEVNMNNDAGWNGSGGPWVTPDKAMQKVVWTETEVEGPQRFEDVLPRPEAVAGYYQDITVLAFPAVGDYRIAVRRREELRASLLPNLNLLDRVPSLDNNDPLLPDVHRRYGTLVEELGAGAGALLRAAGVTRAFGVAPDGWTGTTPAVAPDADGATAWLVEAAEWRESDEAISAALRDPAWDPAQTVILAGEERLPPTPNPSPARGEGPKGRVFLPSPLVGEGPGMGDESGNRTAQTTSESLTPVTALPAERRFHVATDAPAYLVFAETWYPGWSATVNGAPAPLLRANLAFQAVGVPAGESEVVFCYRINDFGAGAAISAGALIAALALLPGERIRRSRAG